MLKVLDIGCGGHKVKMKGTEVIGIDVEALPGVDVVHDVNKGLPFDDNGFDMVCCINSLEHFDDAIFVLKEIWRVLKPNGILKILCPHVSSASATGNLVHKRCLNIDSLIAINGFKQKKARLIFADSKSRLNFLNIIINPIINFSPRLYERFFCWVLPCQYVYFELNSLK